MTLYHVTIGKKDYQVEVAGNQFRVNGKEVPANLTPLNEIGLYLINNNGRKREIHLSPKGAGIFTILSGGRHIVAQVERAGNHARRAAAASDQGSLCAPMPGVVIQVCTQPGQKVAAGQVLVVLESMKMQMELKSAVSGVVQKVRAVEHAQVDKGAVLVEISVD
jgi:biotin carboxyl carrier protein